MPYMGSSIHRHEELAAGMLDADDCSICRGKSETRCDNCRAEICRECAVSCGHCQTDAYCIACAIKNGYVESDGQYYCENCACEMEPELEMARR